MSLPVIKGGQTLFHSIHMLAQVTGYLLFGTIFAFIVISSSVFFSKTNPSERYLLFKWIEGNVIYLLNHNGKVTYSLGENTTKIPVKHFLELTKVQQEKNQIKLKEAVVDGCCASLIVALFFIIWFKLRGKSLSEAKIQQGRYLADSKILIKKMKQVGELSDLKIANIPLFKNSECQHILIHGSSGTGKSVVISDLLLQIKQRGDKAIIYDKHGSFIRHFYDEQQDILLNPMDARCSSWNPWAECKTQADFEQFAASLIPHSTRSQGDPFWINSARSLLAATAFGLQNHNEPSITKLLTILFSGDLTLLKKYIKGTEAESLGSNQIEKVAQTVKSVLANYIKPLRYLKEDGKIFSIREWVSEDSNQWLFISSMAKYHEAIKPLVSCWLDVAANQLLTLIPNPNRRLWFILDELSSLQKLPGLQEALAESRKFGGCIVLGLQNVFQLNEHYGHDGTKAITDLCNTKVFFRAPSYQCAEWVAKEIGMQDTLESREGISYGAHHVRDGVSMQQHTTQKSAVSATELMNLPDLNAIVCIPPIKSTKKNVAEVIKQWPVVRSCISIMPLVEKDEGFIYQIIPELISDSINDVTVLDQKLEIGVTVLEHDTIIDHVNDLYEL